MIRTFLNGVLYMLTLTFLGRLPEEDIRQEFAFLAGSLFPSLLLITVILLLT